MLDRPLFAGLDLRSILIGVAALAVAVLLAVGVYVVHLEIGESPVKAQLINTPSLVGQDIEKARQKALALDLKIKIDQWVPNKTYVRNQVISQNPSPGHKIKKGDRIVVKVSAGNEDKKAVALSEQKPDIKENPKPLPAPAIMPSKSLTGKTVVIDPGHGGGADLTREPIGPGSTTLKVKNPGGATGVDSHTPESQITLAISEKLKAKLTALGIRVIMTRETNLSLGNVERAQIANRAHADLFIRIHADSDKSPLKNGISTLYPALNSWTSPIYRQSYAAARLIQRSVVLSTKHKDNGVVARGDLTGFNWSKVPVVLVETGFLSNPQEDALLNQAFYQDLVAGGISKGALDYLQSAKQPN